MKTDRIRMESDSDNIFYYIYSNTNTNSNVFEYKYKTDISNLETHLDIYSIWKTTFTNFIFDILQLQNHVKTESNNKVQIWKANWDLPLLHSLFLSSAELHLQQSERRQITFGLSQHHPLTARSPSPGLHGSPLRN
jgi:hypothetical protein